MPATGSLPGSGISARPAGYVGASRFPRFAHRASTALRAISLRSAAESLAARAGPPFLPPRRPRACNLTACHNCALVPETSCEEFNRFLDRGLVVGSMDNPGLGFFGDLTRN